MKNEDYGKPSFLKTGKRILVGSLALSMALSGTTWASLNTVFKSDVNMKTQSTIKMGDVNFDGSVDLADANLTLKAALNISDLTGDAKTAADVDNNNSVDLADANMVLKAALNIISFTERPSSETPVPSAVVTPTASSTVTTTPPVTATPTPTPTVTPTATPSPIPTYTIPVTLAAVEANPANVVTGTPMQVLEENGANNYSNDGIIEFTETNLSRGLGAELVNPFAGKAELQQSAVSATSFEAEEGKVSCWNLSGSSFKDVVNPDWLNMDPRIYNKEDTSTVTYTRPVWTNGVTMSFWLKAQSVYKAEPILTLANNNLVLMIRLNGTVKFRDGNDGNNYLNNGSTSFAHGTYGEWNYYTITIANDWVQVYVNGQENLFTSLELKRSDIRTFNDGFLTRYNTINSITEEDVKNDPRKYLVKSGEWYYNSTYEKWMAHDEYTVFHNARYRGANGGGKLIMDLVTDTDTQMWIGGGDTNVETTATTHKLAAGSRAAGLTYFMDELTPEQIAANYSVVATPNPSPTMPPATPTPTPDPSSTPAPTVDPDGGVPVSFATSGPGSSAKIENNVITFGDPTASAIDKVAGVPMINPFSNSTAKAKLNETIEQALTGQSIFPWKDVSGNSFDVYKEGYQYRGGHDRYAVEVWRGNFYDVYYGPVAKYGNMMTPRAGASTSGSTTKADIMSMGALELTYGNMKTTYHRPVWTSGASISFWAKPTQVDDSPLISFYKSASIMLYVDVRGDVAYYSLDDQDWNNGTKGVLFNGEPHNTFVTLGNADAVKANEWNFYTVTIANDWIQVYINGKEMVYDFVNLNRTENKSFNYKYLSRYNTIGIWNKDMLNELGDPSGKTAEGTQRNYLTKSGLYYDLDLPANASGLGPLSDKGPNTGKDGASIRGNNVYEKPFGGSSMGGRLLMDLFTDNRVLMYVGGVYSVLDNGEFTFSQVKVASGTSAELVRYLPVDGNNDGVEDQGANKKIYTAKHTLDAGTQVYTVKSYMKELTAAEVKTSYEHALAETTSPGAITVK